MEQQFDAQELRDQKDIYYAWAWLLGVVALGFVVGLGLVTVPEAVTRGETKLPFWVKAAILAELTAVSCWFIAAFTGDAYRKRTHAIILSYFFVVASLLVLIVPPFGIARQVGGEPLGLVSGCVIGTDAREYAKELQCLEDGTQPARVGKAPADDSKAEKRAEGKDNISEAKDKARGKEDKAAEKKDKATDKKEKAAEKKDETLAEKKDEKKDGAKPAEEAPQKGAKTDKPPRNLWLINIGGTLTPQARDQKPVFVSGGIAVPLYFVILALIGGAISLSRRVPEFQKRSENDYVGTDKEPKLQPSEVREELAFQILQFISAPLIAVTAYQVIRPDSAASTAALAFLCGFGSETILLMIRGVVNGLQPQSVTPASTGTVSGSITDGGKPVPNIQVEVAGTALKSKSDDQGQFRMREVPVGGRELKASDHNRSGSARVSVQSGQTVNCDIALKQTGSVSGTVKNAGGEALKAALVTVAAAPSLLKTTTDNDGKYRIERVPIGQQTINAEHTDGSNKISGSVTVTVEYDKSANCEITLNSPTV